MSEQKKSSPCEPASITREANHSTPGGGSYLLYSIPRSKSQDKAQKNREQKLRLVAALFCTMFFVMLGTACWLWPVVIPYVLAPFAVAGAWKFCRVAYIWMSTDPFYEEDETWQ